LPKLENVSVSTGKICIMSCITDMLNYCNLKVDESTIFTFAEAQLFYYKPVTIEELETCKGDLPLFSIKMGGMKYDIAEMIGSISNSFGLKTEFQAGYDKYDIKQFITKHIDNEQPIIALLSRKHLDYMNAELRDDISHSINITGYDWTKNKIYIGDTYIPTIPIKNYIGSLDFESYYKSLIASKDIFNKQLSFRNIAIDGKGGTSFEDLTFEQKVNPLAKIADCFFHGEELEDGNLVGQKAYHEFLTSVEQWMAKEQSPVILKLFRIIHHRLTNFGGLTITYSLLAEYIGKLFQYTKDTEYQELQNLFLTLIKKWSVIANMFCKASLGRYEDVRKSITSKIEEAIILEEKVYRMIETLNK